MRGALSLSLFFITGTFKNKFFILFSNTLQKPLPRRKLVCFCFFASGGRVSLLPGDFYIIIDWSSSPGFKPGASSSEICCATEANRVWWILNVVLMNMLVIFISISLSCNKKLNEQPHLLAALLLLQIVIFTICNMQIFYMFFVFSQLLNKQKT